MAIPSDVHNIAMGLGAVEVEVKHLDRRLGEVSDGLEKLDGKVDALDAKVDQVLLKLVESQGSDPTTLLASPKAKKAIGFVVTAVLSAVATWFANHGG